MNDIAITQIREHHQTVVVLAGEDYVALEVDFPDLDSCEGSGQPDAVVLLGTAGAERLACAIVSATIKARQAPITAGDAR